MSKVKTPAKTIKKPDSKAKSSAQVKSSKSALPSKTAVKTSAKDSKSVLKPVKSAAKASKTEKAKSAKTAPSSKAVSKTLAKSKPISKSEAKAKDKLQAKQKQADSKASSASKKTSMPKGKVYSVDQKVVYPSQGVGVIKEIVQKKFNNEKIPYYIIYLEVTDMTIMVPVEKAIELGIRSTVSKDEANKALDLLTEEYDAIPSDWKMRYQMNLDLLKKGSIRDIASIVRSLYHRSKVKELPIQERKLYDSALKLFIDEVSISLKKSKEDIESIVFSRLEIDEN